MFKVLIALTGFASVLTIVVGVPANLGGSDEVEKLLAYDDYHGFKEFTVFTNQSVNWFGALQLCSKYGLVLASINSPAETAQLQTYLIDNDLIEENYWISGNSLASGNKWFWTNNGKALSYTNWASGQPDNSDGYENCLELISEDGKWNDLDCNAYRYFICENRYPLGTYQETVYPPLE